MKIKTKIIPDPGKFPTVSKPIPNRYDEPVVTLRARESSKETIEHVEGYRNSGIYGETMTKVIYEKRSFLEVLLRVTSACAFISLTVAAWAVVLAL